MIKCNVDAAIWIIWFGRKQAGSRHVLASRTNYMLLSDVSQKYFRRIQENDQLPRYVTSVSTELRLPWTDHTGSKTDFSSPRINTGFLRGKCPPSSDRLHDPRDLFRKNTAKNVKVYRTEQTYTESWVRIQFGHPKQKMGALRWERFL